MSSNLYIIRRYRLSENNKQMLDFVRKKHLNESEWVRMAIIEKFERDYPNNKLNKIPF